MKPMTPKYVRDLAKGLRVKQTQAEENLWFYLRRKGLSRYKFYRQYPIGRYIADFCCPEKKLVVEIDGEIHNTEGQKEYDKVRESVLHSEGMHVIHFSNDDVLYRIDVVLQSITQARK